MLELLGKAGCSSIDGIYYSTTNLKEDIYAKPNVGMFKRAEQELGVKFKGGAFVGDKLSDLKAADKIGAIPILVKTGHGEETLKELNRFTYRNLKKKTMIFDNLWSFAETLPWNEE
jgi:histidinol phosphatase-like enzyme